MNYIKSASIGLVDPALAIDARMLRFKDASPIQPDTISGLKIRSFPTYQGFL
jgi:hypothetical protein